MSAEELSQFYEFGEAAAFNNWLDEHELTLDLRNELGGMKVMSWRGSTGDYTFTREQYADFMAIRNSPLYKALL